MYKIVCKDEELNYIYVGHTTVFIKRKCQHKKMSLTSTIKLYQTIRDNGGWDNFKMLQIESFPCNNNREAEAREDLLMIELKANMNDRRSFRNAKQYRHDNKERICEKKKQHYEANKEQILAQQKQYKEANKEQIKQYYQANKEQKKQYYEANKEQKKQYYEANKERINIQVRARYQAKKHNTAATTTEPAELF